MNQKNHLLISFLIGGFFITLDQYLKLLARTHTETQLYLWKPYLGWEYFANPGVAFSIPFPNWLIVAITPLALLIIIIALTKKPQLTPLTIFGPSLVIFGAISNYIDRVLFGVTIDYGRLFTSVVNIADIMIVSGAFLMILAEFKNKKIPSA